MWTKPSYTEMRFGFEVTMYIMNRYSFSSNYLSLLYGINTVKEFFVYGRYVILFYW